MNTNNLDKYQDYFYCLLFLFFGYCSRYCFSESVARVRIFRKKKYVIGIAVNYCALYFCPKKIVYVEYLIWIICMYSNESSDQLGKKVFFLNSKTSFLSRERVMNENKAAFRGMNNSVRATYLLHCIFVTILPI